MMIQGKIERWHQTLKNRFPLENYFLPGDLKAQIKAFVADYNHYHETRLNEQTIDHYQPLAAGLTASGLTSPQR